ncbi:MAG: MaoC family dehydratase [Actinobacteria bacterium]|nr:MaoC family dehydratase [Actinomycetota bacterium]
MFSSISELDDAVGTHLGHSDWIDITQERINLFAEATSDHQWIHIDPERAAQGPFGTTIAHGYLTLSLAVPATKDLLHVEGAQMGINYGANKVRFISPVPVDSRVRAGASVAAVEDFGGGRAVTLDVTFEIEGAEKPACVAQVIFRIYG